MLANRVRELTSTTGTGDIALAGALPGHIGFSDAFTIGDSVIYVIEDGDNYEIGTGTLVGAQTLERTDVAETLVDGVYAQSGATPIDLSGNARIYCAATADFLLSPTHDADIIREVTPDAGVTADGVLLKDGGILASSAITVDVAASGATPIRSVSDTTGNFTHIELVTGVFQRGKLNTNGETLQLISNGALELHDASGKSLEISGGTVAVPKDLRVGEQFRLSPTMAGFPALASSEAVVYASDTLGAVIGGRGSSTDVYISNRNGAGVMKVLANSVDVEFNGAASLASHLTVLGQTTMGSSASIAGSVTVNGNANQYLGILQDQDINLTLGSVAGTDARIYLYGTGNGQANAGDIDIRTSGNAGTVTIGGDLSVLGGVSASGIVNDLGTHNDVAFSQRGRMSVGQVDRGGILTVANRGLPDQPCLILEGASGQSGNVFEARSINVGSADLFSVDQAGNVATGGSLSVGTTLNVSGVVSLSSTIFAAANAHVGYRSDGQESILNIGKQASNNGGQSTLQFFSHNGALGNGYKIRFFKDVSHDELRFIDGGEKSILVLSNLDKTATFTGNVSVASDRLDLGGNTNTGAVQKFHADRVGVNQNIMSLEGWWNGTRVASVTAQSGTDLVGKGSGELIFTTAPDDATGIVTRLRIEENGRFQFHGNELSGLASMHSNVDTSNVNIAGGSSLNSGANLYLYGPSHASQASDILFKVDATNALLYDNSNSEWNFEGNKIVRVGPGNDVSMRIGADSTGADITDATIKVGRVGVPHYLNAEEPVGVWSVVSDGTENQLRLGGATSLMNAPTEISFWTASDAATVTGSQQWKISNDGSLVSLGGTVIRRASDTGSLSISGGTSTAIGANLILYGAGHVSEAGNIYLRKDTAPLLKYDDNIQTWDFMNLAVAGVDHVVRGAGADNLGLSGGTTPSAGGNIILYGESHATNPGDILFRDGASDILIWDSSALGWNFLQTEIINTPTIRRAIAASQLNISGGSTNTQGGNIILYGESHATNANDMIFRGGTSPWLSWDDSAGAATIGGHLAIASTKRLRVGGMPRSDWSTSYDVIEVGETGAMMAATSATSGDAVWLGGNWYFDGAYKYRSNGYAAQLYINNAGDTIVRTAANNASGQGAELTWDDVLTVYASGNVGLGGGDLLDAGAGTFSGELQARNVKVDTNGIGGLDASGSVLFGGGTNAGTYGANILMYAETGVSAYDMSFRAGSVAWLYRDHSLSEVTLSDKLVANTGVKVGVQNQVDGGSGHGLFLWDTTDLGHGIYMATSGVGRSLSDGDAATSLDGRTGYMIRNRINSSAARAFGWENSSEIMLMSLAADTGDLYTKGNLSSFGRLAVGGTGLLGSSISTFNATASLNQVVIDQTEAGAGPTLYLRNAADSSKAIIKYTNNGLDFWNASSVKTAGLGSDGSLDLGTNADAGLVLNFHANRSLANATISNIAGNWNGDDVAQIRFLTGDDTLNKDNGQIQFLTATSAASGPLVALTIDQDQSATFAGDVAAGLVRGRTTTGALSFYGGQDNTGAHILLYAGSHATNADDILFRAGGITQAQWDHNEDVWRFGSNVLTDAIGLYRGDAAAQLNVSGGSASNLGSNFVLYGENHAGTPNDIVLRSGTTEIMKWDDSKATWDVPYRTIFDESGGIAYSGTGFDGVNLLVTARNQTNADGAVFGAIGWTGTGQDGGSSPRVALAAVQQSADNDVVGFQFYTHPSMLSSDPSELAFTINADKTLMASGTSLYRDSASSYFVSSGGSGENAGANMILYGESHPTKANDVYIRSGAATLYHWDDAAATFTLQGTGKLGGQALVRSDDTGYLYFSGGSASAAGANLLMFGGSHDTTPNDFFIRTGSDVRLFWSEANLRWSFNETQIRGMTSIVRGTTANELSVTGGSSTSLGANLYLYGESHASLANDIVFRSGTAEVLKWDDSLAVWDWQNNDFSQVGNITGDNFWAVNASGLKTISGGSGITLGANIQLYGESHATQPWDIVFRQNSNVVGAYDYGAQTWNFQDKDIATTGIIKGKADTTANRPSASTSGAGATMFDTALGKPIWSDGSQWVDATGAAV